MVNRSGPGRGRRNGTLKRKENTTSSSTPENFDRSCSLVLGEITGLTVQLFQKQPTEIEIRNGLQKCFGSIEKGYGSMVALRNALQSVVKKIKGESDANGV